MRWLAAGALAIAVAIPPAAEARVMVAFLPADARAPLLREFEERGMALGLTSPTVGGFKRRQFVLDISQGGRIPTRLYDDELPTLRLGRSTIDGWAQALTRASDAPGDVSPGKLGSLVRRRAYVGITGEPNIEAVVVAAAGAEPLARTMISVGSTPTVGDRAVGAWKDADLVAALLPRGRGGLTALDRILAARRQADRVIAVRMPSGKKTELLPTGVAGMAGSLRSATTRRDGLVAATDYAPTILDWLGLPDADLQGRVIESADPQSAGELEDLAGRLRVVVPRRGTALLALVGALLLLLLVSRRLAARSALLALLWLPAVAMLTAALRPGELVEAAVIALGSLVLGVITGRLVRWPMAPWLPAAAVFANQAVDLAAGSRLTALSLAGPNPLGGARFYGVGNELETMLSVAVLLGAGAALAHRPARMRAIGFAVAGVVAAGILGAGRLGADVGAVITLGAGTAAAIVACLYERPTRKVIALAVAAPVAGLVGLALLDLATGGDSHLTRSVLRADQGGDILDVVQRRFEGSFAGVNHPVRAVVFVIALVAIVWLVRNRERFLAPVRDTAFHAALVGVFFAVVVGALSNDSGPLILEIGTVYLVAAAAYAAARPANHA